MTVTVEQLQAFVAKYPPSEPVLKTGTTVPETRTDDAGSYTHERLGQLLELWSDANPDFSFSIGRTSKGVGYHIVCPGCEGWPDGARHTEQAGKLNSSAAVWVENGHPRFRCSHAHCDQGALGGKKTWKHLVEAWDAGGHMQRRVLTGSPRMGTLGAKDPLYGPVSANGSVSTNAENANLLKAPQIGVTAVPNSGIRNESQVETKPAMSPRYPTEVWDGTEYAEYARRGTKGNFIPPEFFIESLKTYVGAIAGNNMLIANERSGRARFYTILLAGPGTGKNTAIDCTHDLFRVHNSGLTIGDWPAEALVWYPQHKIETRLYKRIGACRMKMSSASGLARSLPRLGKDGKLCNSPQERLVVVYTELAEMFEKLGIEGSGAAMMSALCDLYDGEEFVVPALADNDSFGGRLMMSILAGIQPRKWDIVCAGKGIEGSGFDERINLIPTTNTRTVASLDDPDLIGFKEPFLDRLMALDAEPYVVKATREAKALADEEYQKLKPKDEEGTSAGRLNVLAWRNALHYAWLTRAAVVDAEAVGRGMKLARYQLEVRKAYKPLSGDNATARAANAIQRFMEKHSVGSDVRFRVLERAVHADRLGPVFDSGLAHLGARGRIIVHEQKIGAHTARFVRRVE